MADQDLDVARTPAPAGGEREATAGGGGASAGNGGNDWAWRMQRGMGNQAVADAIQAPPAGPGEQAPPGRPQDHVPSSMALESAGLSFRLPGNTALTGDWNQLQTTAPTGVWITVTPRALRVQFSPALEVDAQWPHSNVAWSGFTFDFASGKVSDVGVENTQFAIPISGTVRDSVTSFVMKTVAGTKLGKGGYNPLQDADLTGTLAALQANMASQATGGKQGDLKPRQVNGFALHASAKTREKVEAGAPGGGIQMPAGAGITVAVSLAGNGETIGSTPPNVQSVDVSSSDLTLLSGGKPIAKLRSMRVDRGGKVDVTDFEPLGKLAEVGAGESLIRLFGALIALESGDRRALNADLNPRVVNGVAEAQIEKALTEAVQTLVRDHHDLIPGFDLRAVLGMDAAAPTGRAGPKT